MDLYGSQGPCRNCHLIFFVSLYEFAVQCKDVGACTQTKNEHWHQEEHFLCAYVKWRLFRCLWETFKVCQHSFCFLFSLIFSDSGHVALLVFLAVDKFNCKSGFDQCHVIPESIWNLKFTDLLVWKNCIKWFKNLQISRTKFLLARTIFQIFWNDNLVVWWCQIF